MNKYTIGLMARHVSFKTPKLVKVWMEHTEDGNVKMTVDSAHNLSRINSIKEVVISQAEYDDRPFDVYNNLIEARWAFEKMGLTIRS